MAVTMKGKNFDMASCATRHATVRAVGNAKMNARGDKVGPGGVILKSREQIDKEILAYHRENPNAVRSSSISALESEVYTPSEALTAATQAQPVQIETSAEKPAKTKKVVSQD